MIRSIIVNIDPTSISPLGLIITRTFGFKTNPRDPHNKYEDATLHGKKMFYPKYGNSFYEALEYDRKLENSGNYDQAKKTKQNSKAQPQKEELKTTTQVFTKPHDKHAQFVNNSTVDTKNDLLYLLPP